MAWFVCVVVACCVVFLACLMGWAVCLFAWLSFVVCVWRVCLFGGGFGLLFGGIV